MPGRIYHLMSVGNHWERGRTAAIIPAWNEAATVGAVVYAALDARLVDEVTGVDNAPTAAPPPAGAGVYPARDPRLGDEVIVVENASTDATAAEAAPHGARVVSEPVPGK